jgi:hypothetical protein
VKTLEHRRFAEFCDARKRYRSIGLCYGVPGVGKTVSARHYTNWDRMQDFWNHPGRDSTAVEEIAASTTVFYTAPVVGSPCLIETQIGKLRDRLHSAAIDVRRKVEEAEMRRLLSILDDLRDRLKNPDGYRSQETEDAEDAFLKQRHRAMGSERVVPDPTALLVIDEADRLKIAGLEQTRSIFDQGGVGMILIGMPGIEKRLARYPQFYSRIGFVHEFRTLAAAEIRQLFDHGWIPSGVNLPKHALGPRNRRDDHPDDRRQLPIIESSLKPDRAGSRNQRASRSDEGGSGSRSPKPGDRRSPSLPEGVPPKSELCRDAG